MLSISVACSNCAWQTRSIGSSAHIMGSIIPTPNLFPLEVFRRQRQLLVIGNNENSHHKLFDKTTDSCDAPPHKCFLGPKNGYCFTVLWFSMALCMPSFLCSWGNFALILLIRLNERGEPERPISSVVHHLNVRLGLVFGESLRRKINWT